MHNSMHSLFLISDKMKLKSVFRLIILQLKQEVLPYHLLVLLKISILLNKTYYNLV
jgi:hypothetical protein